MKRLIGAIVWPVLWMAAAVAGWLRPGNKDGLK